MTDHLLFSYGTLRDPAVQRALFGRRLEEEADALAGWRIETIRIGDARVEELSGLAEHLILRPSGDPADLVPGAVLHLSGAELAIADDYETGAYVRVEADTRDGRRAWVYVAADAVAGGGALG